MPGAGNDSLVGGAGNDLIFGGDGGGDALTGSAGNDTFRFDAVGHSSFASPDTIVDFTVGDLISLSLIDANILASGDQAFSFIGSAAFSSAGAASAGQLRFQHHDAALWSIQGDTDGDGAADLFLYVTVTDNDPITAADFVL